MDWVTETHAQHKHTAPFHKLVGEYTTHSA